MEPLRNNLVFELAEASLPSHAMVLHQVSKHVHPHPHARHLELPIAGSAPQLAPLHPLPKPGAASTLNKQLKPMDAPIHHLESWNESNENLETQRRPSLLANLQTQIPRIATSVGSLMQPQGDTHNDNSVDQRIVNIATSLPFFAIGANMLRKHKTPEGREYAYSMLAVGAAATLYHATSGRARRICRKLDYWTIAASSTSMVKALYPQKPWIRRTLNASLLAIPFKPFLVSTASTLAMQAEFAKQAAQHKSIRPYFNRHALCAAASGVAFAVEDLLIDKAIGRHVHGIWHLLAAAGVASTGALVEHKERLRLQSEINPIPALKGLRPCHDSVASLQTLAGSSPTASKLSSPRPPIKE